MRNECIPAKATGLVPRNGVLVLSGITSVSVEKGHLLTHDGRGRERRTGRFPRGSLDLRRLVVLGHDGSVSLAALRWLSDVGASFAQIDLDGEVIAVAGPPGSDDARLRRAQALAASNETGMSIAHDLLARKLAGQSVLLAGRLGAQEAAARVRSLRDRLAEARTFDRLRLIEAKAAGTYWEEWRAVTVRFARRDAARVPDHWRGFTFRMSPRSSWPRNAVNPINALLNYGYALLEAESRLALLAVGLDPGMGVLHADQRGRDSLALDLMEAVRPSVDGWVLDQLRTRTFARTDFAERPDGTCRLMPPLARAVAEVAPRWAAAVSPLAEGVVAALAGGRMTATPLTGSRRRAAKGGAEPKDERPSTDRLPPACRECGVILDRPGVHYCDACRPGRLVEVGVALGATGPAALAQLRADGVDPSHGGEAGRTRGAKNATHVTANATWDAGRPDAGDPTDFVRDVLPAVRAASVGQLAAASGLSLTYCSLIRRGLKVPHRRHWAALLGLSSAQDK